MLDPAEKQAVSKGLEKNAEVMTNTHLESLLAGQPADVKAEILAINTKARPIALQIALLVPLLAALARALHRFPDDAPSRPRTNGGGRGSCSADEVRGFVNRAARGRYVLLAVSLACASVVASGCSSENDAAGTPFVPVHPGVLTVATAFLPAPGFWEGNPPVSGFEAKLALALAQRLGLKRVQVVQVPFASIVSGHLDGADMAISQLTPTNEREQHLDFTTPYLQLPRASSRAWAWKRATSRRCRDCAGSSREPRP